MSPSRQEIEAALAAAIPKLSDIELCALARTITRVAGNGNRDYGPIMSLERLSQKADPREIADELADAVFYTSCLVEWVVLNLRVAPQR